MEALEPHQRVRFNMKSLFGDLVQRRLGIQILSGKLGLCF